MMSLELDNVFEWVKLDHDWIVYHDSKMKAFVYSHQDKSVSTK